MEKRDDWGVDLLEREKYSVDCIFETKVFILCNQAQGRDYNFIMNESMLCIIIYM